MYIIMHICVYSYYILPSVHNACMPTYRCTLNVLCIRSVLWECVCTNTQSKSDKGFSKIEEAFCAFTARVAFWQSDKNTLKAFHKQQQLHNIGVSYTYPYVYKHQVTHDTLILTHLYFRYTMYAYIALWSLQFLYFHSLTGM